MNLEEHIITGSEYQRKVWLLNAYDVSSPRLGIFLDGESYVNRMDAPRILYELQKNGEIPSLTCVFVSHLNGEARHHDLTCNPGFSSFIANDVFKWCREKNAHIENGRHLISGTSLSGLASAYLMITYPTIFSHSLCQSGSFWWNNEWLTNELKNRVIQRGNYWISVGSNETDFGISHPPTGLRQDISQIDSCTRFCEGISEVGHSVHCNIYEGGHDIKSWKEELPQALKWLFR